MLNSLNTQITKIQQRLFLVEKNGGGGGGNNDWIDNNLINSPPPIVYGTPLSKSNCIYIPWTYPRQINAGFISKYLPEINTFYSYYTSSLANVTVSGNILSNISGDQYIYNYSSTTIPVTGIILIKNPTITIGTTSVSSGSVALIVFPQDSLTRNAYIYYDTTIASLSSSAINTLTSYYQNYNIHNNLSNVIFSSFLQSGIPSEPLGLAFSNSTYSSITITFNRPQYGDLLNPDAVTPIINYKITYASIINTVRYGGLIQYTNNVIVLSAGSNTIDPTTSLYPETAYLIYVSAKNDVNDSYSNISANITANTVILPPGITSLSPLTFPLTTYSAKNINGTSISPLILTNTQWTSNQFTFPINEQANRGLLGTGNLANISISISGNVNLTGPTVDYTGFPISIPPVVTSNNITCTTNTVTDSFSATGYTGYYLQSSSHIILDTPNIFIPTKDSSTITITRTGITSSLQTYKFYYDIPPLAPTIESTVINSINTILNSSYVQICGVYVVYGTPTLNLNINNVNNIGQHFYNNTKILSFSSTVGTISATETNLNNVTNRSNMANDTITGSLTFNPVAVPLVVSDSFKSNISLTCTAYNIVDTSNSSIAVSLPVLIDPKSAALFGSIIISGIGTLGPSLSYGGRIASSALTSPYTRTLYNNTIDISTGSGVSAELQVANGCFQSKIGLDAYLDYTTYYYSSTSQNTVNYSTILTSGYRYATFCWQVAATSSSYSTITFQFNGLTTSLEIDGNNLASIAGSPLLMKYKVEDNASPSLSASSITTTWIDANGSGSVVNSSNYYLPLNLYGNNPVTTAAGSFNVILPNSFNSTTSSGTKYVYLNVGIPINKNFSFTSISAKLSN